MIKEPPPIIKDARSRRQAGRRVLSQVLADLERDRQTARLISRSIVADARRRRLAREAR